MNEIEVCRNEDICANYRDANEERDHWKWMFRCMRSDRDNWEQKYNLLKEDFDVIFNTLMRLVGDGTELEIDLPSGQHVSIKGRYY